MRRGRTVQIKMSSATA